jgi:trk system potassium uptake protein TrkA
VAEVENVDYIPLAERMDIGVIINKMEIAATYIYRLSLSSDIRKVKRMSYADAEIVELTAKEGSKITKGFVKDLNLPMNMFIGGVIRNGESFIVNGMSEIFAGDKVVVFCLKSSIKRLSELFN